MAKVIDRPAQNIPLEESSLTGERSLTPDCHALDPIIGVFREESLMDALMERVRQDRRAEQAAGPGVSIPRPTGAKPRGVSPPALHGRRGSPISVLDRPAKASWGE